MNSAAGTIVAKNFIPFARVLARSFREHHRTVPFFTVLADRPDTTFDPSSEPFEAIHLEELEIPDLRRLCFCYSRQQLSIVLKPYLLRHLLNRGFDAAVFLDADILVLDSLEPLFDETAAQAVALTPHLLEPLSTAHRSVLELNILQSGVYNGGFIGVSPRDAARRFLAWWADRLHTHCRHDTAAGMHYDQRWLDLAPGLFEGVHVVRDAGCNVAHWNLVERRLKLTPVGMRVGSGPCRFFHFSGFEPERPGTVTRYSGRLTMEHVGPAAVLFARYVDLLRAQGYFECREREYSFASFDNNVPIPPIARRIYQEMGDAADQFCDPFKTSGSHSYFRWLNESAGPGSTEPVTRLWDAVYRSRPDVQQRFPDVFAADNAAFRTWILTSGLWEHDISEEFA